MATEKLIETKPFKKLMAMANTQSTVTPRDLHQAHITKSSAEGKQLLERAALAGFGEIANSKRSIVFKKN